MGVLTLLAVLAVVALIARRTDRAHQSA
jgi:hypothetical protein